MFNGSFFVCSFQFQGNIQFFLEHFLHVFSCILQQIFLCILTFAGEVSNFSCFWFVVRHFVCDNLMSFLHGNENVLFGHHFLNHDFLTYSHLFWFLSCQLTSLFFFLAEFFFIFIECPFQIGWSIPLRVYNSHSSSKPFWLKFKHFILLHLQQAVHHVFSWCAGDGVQQTFQMVGSCSFVDRGRSQSSGLEHRNSHVNLQTMASHASSQNRAHPLRKRRNFCSNGAWLSCCRRYFPELICFASL